MSEREDLLPVFPVVDHIISFARVLRRAGIDVGTGQTIDAVRAAECVGVRRRDDLYQALFSTFVTRRDQIDLFDQAFAVFWKAPSRLPDMMGQLLPRVEAPPERQPGATRVQEALGGDDRPKPAPQAVPEREEEVLEFTLTYSARERLATKDFADFTTEEVALAREFLRSLRWPIDPQPVRRRSPSAKGRLLNWRRTARAALRTHGEVVHLRLQGPKRKPRPIVVLCDISGSMDRYARMLLHFMHAVTEGMRRVESFVFGTRLTRVTRHLRRRDIDDALALVSGSVNDWAGGTRIGEALRTFNYTWLRRVLRSNGVVLVISDGCDRGDTELLAREMDRLSRSCHRVIWLNPLLRYDGYEPLTRGMQAAMPYVDDFLPVHNLESLEQLGRVLGKLAG